MFHSITQNMETKQQIISMPNFCESKYCDKMCYNMINSLKEYFVADSASILDYLKTIHSDKLVLAILDLQQFKSFDEYFLQVFSGKRRNEFRKTQKKGYYSKVLNTKEYNSHLNSVFEIHTSKKIRQGEMKKNFYEYPKPQIDCKCSNHFYKHYGIFSKEKKLVGYIQLGIVGEVGDVINIFGHGDFLKDSSIMINLWYCMIADVFSNKNTKYIYYHLFNIGNKGLQHWKKSVGLVPTIVNN